MFVLFWLHQLCFAEPPVSKERAKELFYNGQLLYEEQEFESAILAWQKGYEITQLPAFLKNIALAYEANQEYTEAIDFLKQYRAFAPFEEQEELKSWLTELESLQSAQIEEQANSADGQQNNEKNDSSTSDGTDETDGITTVDTDQADSTHNADASNSSNSASNAQPSSSTNNSIEDKPSNMFLSLAGGTALLATTASISTIRTNNVYTQLSAVCDINSGLCMDGLTENDLLSQFNQSKVTSLSLWGGALIGAGLTVAVQQRSSTVTVQPWNGGLMLGGQF